LKRTLRNGSTDGSADFTAQTDPPPWSITEPWAKSAVYNWQVAGGAGQVVEVVRTRRRVACEMACFDVVVVVVLLIYWSPASLPAATDAARIKTDLLSDPTCHPSTWTRRPAQCPEGRRVAWIAIVKKK